MTAKVGMGVCRKLAVLWAAASLTAAVGAPASEIEMEELDAPHLAVEAELYRLYCGACHGRRGRGDGPIAPYLDPRPLDLTTIERDFQGEFPRYLVAFSVDGRDTVRAHGGSNMPVWGEIFAEELLPDPAARAKAHGKVMKIVDYIESIQR